MLIRPTISSPGKRSAPGVFSFHVFTRRCQWTFLTCSTALMINSAKRWPRHVATCWCWRAREAENPRAGAPYRPVTERRKQLAILHHGGDLYQQSGGGNAPSYWPVDGDQPGGMWVGTFHGLAHRRCARIIWTLICRRISRFSTAKIRCVCLNA